MYGNYRKASTTINGKPHYTSMFSSGTRAIWFSNQNQWIIGYTSEQGTASGFAYNNNNDNCPYDPAFDWQYLDRYRNWASAGDGLSIYNQC